MFNRNKSVTSDTSYRQHADYKCKAARLVLKEHHIKTVVYTPRHWCKLNNVSYSANTDWYPAYTQYVDNIVDRYDPY